MEISTYRNCDVVFKAGAPETQYYTATISTDSVDAVGEVLLPTGADATSYYARGAPVFWAHDYSRPPIAKTVGRLRVVQRRIEADFRFADRPEAHDGEWFPDTIRALIDQEVIRGVSVGLNRVESRAPTAKDRELYGERVQLVTTRWELLEWSIAPLQCNPDALIEAVVKGIIDKHTAKSLFGVSVEPKRSKLVMLVALGTSGQRRAPRPAVAAAKIMLARRMGLVYI